MRQRRSHSVWALANHEEARVGAAGVGIVSLRVVLSLCLLLQLSSFQKFFHQERAVRRVLPVGGEE